MAVITNYIGTLVNDVTIVFCSGCSIQTITIAIAIAGSVCCSVVIFIVNLIRSLHHAEKIHKQTHKKKQYYHNQYSDYKSPLSSSMTKAATHSRALASQLVCLRCRQISASNLCNRQRCGHCCCCDQAICFYHRTKLSTFSKPSPRKLDLSNQGLACCPDRTGFIGSHVATLNLAQNCLTTVPQEFGCLKWLQHLDLTDNKLICIPECLGNLSRLQELCLGKNLLTFLPESFGNLRSLQHLTICDNQLQNIPSSLGHLKELKHLNISHNQLKYLPVELALLDNLNVLHVAHNPLPRLLPEIGNFLNLLDLNASHCCLSSLPDSIVSCSNLVRLNASNNLLEYLPAKIGRLHHLRNLNVDCNRLVYLPTSLLGLQLRNFSANGNQFGKREDIPAYPKLEGDNVTVPSLAEWSCKAVVFGQIKWQLHSLPSVIKAVLTDVRYCHNCEMPMFSHYKSKLEFQPMNPYQSLPFYQHVCNWKTSRKCQFLSSERL